MSKISIERQDEIDRVINNLLDSIDMSCPENTIIDIMRGLDVGVYETDFDSNQLYNVSGAILYKDGKPTIFINSKQPTRRKAFTLAHELGHYLLHENNTHFRLDKQSYDNSDMEETEANYFAASLLMPKKRFIEVYNFLKSEKLVGEYFGVSVSAVRARKAWIRTN